MNKDIFEQVLRDQLKSAEADVPANAWASIQSQIGPNAIPTPPSTGGFGMSFGLVAGAGLLISVASYSSYRTNQMTAHETESKLVHVSNSDAVSEDNVETINFDEASAQTEIDKKKVLAEGKPTANIAVVQKAKSSEIVHEPSSRVKSNVHDKMEPKNATGQIDYKVSNAEVITKSQANEPSSNTTKSVASSNAIVEENSIAEAQTADGTTLEEVVAIDAIIGASEISGYTPMKVKFDNLGEGLNYEWNFGSYGTRYEKSPEITFDEPGTYSVYLTVSNELGDVVTDVVQVRVKEGSHLYFPNAITPNGDGRNDTYKADAYLIESFLMMITTENGDVVFETRDIKQAWNFDQSSFDAAGERYYVTYKGIGVDGKVHAKHRMPLTIILH